MQKIGALLVVLLGGVVGVESRIKRGLVPGTGWAYYYPEQNSRDHSLKGIDGSGEYAVNWGEQWIKQNYPQNVGNSMQKKKPPSTKFEKTGGALKTVGSGVSGRVKPEDDVIPSSPTLINRKGYKITTRPTTLNETIPPTTLFRPSPSNPMNSEKIEAVPLCSENHNGQRRTFAYSRKYKQCFRAGSRGPCKVNMRFYFDAINSEYGSCDCDIETGYSCGRPLIYIEDEDWCYPTNTQGPCGTRQWLVLGPSGAPRCETNPCIHQQRWDNAKDTDCKHWVSVKGKCFETSVQGSCYRNEILLWDIYNSRTTTPTCSPVSRTLPNHFMRHEIDYSRIDPSLPCLPGMKQTIAKKCRPNYK